MAARRRSSQQGRAESDRHAVASHGAVQHMMSRASSLSDMRHKLQHYADEYDQLQRDKRVMGDELRTMKKRLLHLEVRQKDVHAVQERVHRERVRLEARLRRVREGNAQLERDLAQQRELSDKVHEDISRLRGRADEIAALEEQQQHDSAALIIVAHQGEQRLRERSRTLIKRKEALHKAELRVGQLDDRLDFFAEKIDSYVSAVSSTLFDAEAEHSAGGGGSSASRSAAVAAEPAKAAKAPKSRAERSPPSRTLRSARSFRRSPRAAATSPEDTEGTDLQEPPPPPYDAGPARTGEQAADAMSDAGGETMRSASSTATTTVG